MRACATPSATDPRTAAPKRARTLTRLALGSALALMTGACATVWTAGDFFATTTPEGVVVHTKGPQKGTLSSSWAECRALDAHEPGCRGQIRALDGGGAPFLTLDMASDCVLRTLSVQTAEGSYAKRVPLSYEDPTLVTMERADLNALAEGGFLVALFSCDGDVPERLAAIDLPADQMAVIAGRLVEKDLDT